MASFQNPGSGGVNGRKEAQDPIEHASRTIAEAQAFGRSVSAASQSLKEKLDLNGRVQRSPITSVLVAAGIGYVLGGGLFSPATKKALRLGMRLAILPMVKGQLAGIVGSAIDHAGEPL